MEDKKERKKREGYQKNRMFLKRQMRIEDYSNFEFYVTPKERCNLDLRNYSDLGFNKKDYD